MHLDRLFRADGQVFEGSVSLFRWGSLCRIIAVLVGMAVVFLSNWLIDKRTEGEVPHTASSLHPKTHDNIDELSHIDHYNQHLKEHAPKRELGLLVWSSHVLSRSITFQRTSIEQL